MNPRRYHALGTSSTALQLLLYVMMILPPGQDCFSCFPATHGRLNTCWSATSPTVWDDEEASAAAVGRTVRRPSSSQQRGPVLFQKVVHPPPQHASSLEFLGSLVDWLHDAWTLPRNLPMVYEKEVSRSTATTDNDAAVLTLNSPLSPHPLATALYVQVVAVYPHPPGSPATSSSVLAMVVVSQHVDGASQAHLLPPMLQNLFQSTEQGIIRHLDRSLQDWSPSAVPSSKASAWEDATVDMWNDFLETQQENEIEGDMGDKAIQRNVVDAELVTKNGATDGNHSNNDQDFAVQAARRMLQKQKEEGFAVQAARRRVQQQPVPQRTIPPKTSGPVSPTTAATTTTTTTPLEEHRLQQPHLRPPCLSDTVLKSSRSFAHTISRPRDFLQHRRQKDTSQMGGARDNATNATTSTTTPTGNVAATAAPPAAHPSKFPRLNIVAGESPTDPQNDEHVRLANQAMDEMVQATDDLSAQDLLEAVMQFGKEQEPPEGVEFGNGALEKAKELLRQQQHRHHHKRRLLQEPPHPVTDAREEPASSPVPMESTWEATTPSEPPVSMEDELRRMFEAGESMADQRITTRLDWHDKDDITTTKSTREDAQMVQDLVSSRDTEVSSYARILDDELVELEMRLNKSPQESIDGSSSPPGPNPVFDVLSGPEVYDRNVDPQVAVNWPGAAPDSIKTNIHLPRQLTEAVRQAKFAAQVLSSLEERSENGETLYFTGNRALSAEKVDQMKAVVDEASELGLISDPLTQLAERARLQMVIDELWHQPEERFRDVASEYKDLLLSENFVTLIKHRLKEMADRDMEALRRDNSTLAAENHREREVLGGLVAYAQLLLKEVQALGAELEAQQLEVIRSICKVAMDPSLQTEEDTATALSDAVRDMRPMFDDAFVAYLKYAVAEEEARLARSGVLDDPDHTQWLYVLKIVQQGVYKEISRGISRYIDHIFYILRMKTPQERRMLLSEIIDALPTMDVRPFVRTVESIAGALGDSARGEFDGCAPLGELTNEILQLQHDTKELLPPERIAHMSRDADEWARRKKEKLLEQRKVTKQRLKAAHDTEHLDETIDAMSRQGEMDRFD